MATTELLLVKPVEKLGYEGDRVKVRAGYARNYLLPKKIAVPITRANQKQIDALLQRREERLKHEFATAEAIAERLTKIACVISVKAGVDGKLFGSVTAADLEKHLKEAGASVERKQILLGTPVKTLGKHSAKIKLHSQKEIEFSFEVISEDNEEPKDVQPS